MKCLPSCSSWPRLASSSEGLHARRVFSFTVSRHQLGVHRPHPPPQTDLISKSHSRALPRRFNSRSPVQLSVILDSDEAPKLMRTKCWMFEQSSHLVWKDDTTSQGRTKLRRGQISYAHPLTSIICLSI